MHVQRSGHLRQCCLPSPRLPSCEGRALHHTCRYTQDTAFDEEDELDDEIVDEEIDPDYVPTEDEIVKYGNWLG